MSHPIIAGITSRHFEGVMTASPDERLAVLVVGAGTDSASFDEVLADPERRVAQRYNVGKRGGMVLVRPDGYIGLRAGFGDDDAVSAYRAGIFAG